MVEQRKISDFDNISELFNPVGGWGTSRIIGSFRKEMRVDTRGSS